MFVSKDYKQMERCVQRISSEFLYLPDGNSVTCTSCTPDLFDFHLPDSE